MLKNQQLMPIYFYPDIYFNTMMSMKTSTPYARLPKQRAKAEFGAHFRPNHHRLPKQRAKAEWAFQQYMEDIQSKENAEWDRLQANFELSAENTVGHHFDFTKDEAKENCEQSTVELQWPKQHDAGAQDKKDELLECTKPNADHIEKCDNDNQENPADLTVDNVEHDETQNPTDDEQIEALDEVPEKD